MAEPPQRKRILITVRTYPTPAEHGVEVSCTAGIVDGHWIRLFPIPYRFLNPDKRFTKYQWIDATVHKARDARPESFNIDADSITIVSDPLSTANEWAERKRYVFPLLAHCLCCLKKLRDAHGAPTLGIFKPRSIEKLIINPDSPTWTQKQLETLRTGQLFQKTPHTELEKVPYEFKYAFRCNEDSCTGHLLSCTDWEMGEAWRQWKDRYGESWEPKFRQRFETDMIHRLDTYFYVGTLHTHPASWIIVGLFYPPRVTQGSLF